MQWRHNFMGRRGATWCGGGGGLDSSTFAGEEGTRGTYVVGFEAGGQPAAGVRVEVGFNSKPGPKTRPPPLLRRDNANPSKKKCVVERDLVTHGDGCGAQPLGWAGAPRFVLMNVRTTGVELTSLLDNYL